MRLNVINRFREAGVLTNNLEWSDLMCRTGVVR